MNDIRSRYQKRFFWDSEDAFRVRTDEAPEGMELPKNKFILHRYKARSGHPSRAGVLRVVAWMYLFKNYTLKDWVAFCEVYGMPLRLGKYQPGASEDDKRALMQALAQIGADAAGIIPDGTTIDFITTEKTSSTDLYERLARYCDEQISKAILGQTLTSDSGGGSYAQSKTHNDVRHDLTVADCKALASTLRRDLIRQGGDQVLDGADTADKPAGLAGVGLGIAALAVMSVLAVQQVFRIRANLVIIAAVRIGERPQGVALVRMLMAAVAALGGRDVAAVLRMLPVMGTERGVRLRRKRPGRAQAQAQGQSGDDA